MLQVEVLRTSEEDDGPRQPPLEQVVFVKHPDSCQSVTHVWHQPDAAADGLLLLLPPEEMAQLMCKMHDRNISRPQTCIYDLCLLLTRHPWSCLSISLSWCCVT